MYLKDKRILVLTDYDSRFKWGLSLLQSICGTQSVPMVEVYYKSVPQTIFSRYRFKGDLIQYDSFESHKLKSSIVSSDLVILGLGGGDNLKIINFIYSLGSYKRPLIVAGFNGLVDFNDPNPLLCRLGADLICVNNQVDMTSYSKILESLKIPIKSLVLTGYQRGYLKEELKRKVTKSRDLWLFIEQIGVPDTDRRINYLIEKLIFIAKANPDIDLVIHCRHVQGYKTVSKGRETSFRRNWKKYKKEINKLRNIKLVDGLIED